MKARDTRLLAAVGDHVETARVLVAAGADPDAQDQQWGSPWLVTGERCDHPARPVTDRRHRSMA
ncbi:hypothetical protein [Streptomyces sp. NPDC020817]|uniref:hypothetical protein n=1 Tax=Streptomyces sp. NPDC020817 TaxID=3365095 RepID=UPI00379B4866